MLCKPPLPGADFLDSLSSMWLAVALVHLDDLVIHDAYMDVRAPIHELPIAIGSSGQMAYIEKRLRLGCFLVRDYDAPCRRR
tara:strand:+ start:14927 stop:15172 length:246 start_codon:yes stop_codon:yes gene_type:complete